MTTEQVASWTGLSARYFEKLRQVGGGPAAVRVSPRAVRYDVDDVEAWMESRKVMSTSEAT
jgi:predicted DNA-binding transcriptional regulator AlpA